MLADDISLTLFQTQSIASLLLILSYIPSLANTIKSWSSYILNDLISGTAITTFLLPPLFSILASISPKVLETDSLPGKTL